LRALLQGSFFSFLLRSVGHLIRFSVGVVLARQLGPAVYGAYYYAFTLISLVSVPAILGMDHTLLRFIPKYLNDKEYSRIRGIIGFSNRTAALAIAAVGGLALVWCGYSSAEYRVVYFLIVITLPLIVLGQIRQSAVRAFHHPILAQFPENILYPGVILVLLLSYQLVTQRAVTGEVAAVINLISWSATFLGGVYIFQKKCFPFLRVGSDSSERSSWIGPAPGLIVSGLSFILLSRGEILVLGQLVSKHDLGIYTAASRAAEMIQFAYEAICLGGSALFSRTHAGGNRSEVQTFVTRATDVIFWVTLPVFLFLFYFATPLLAFFGQDYIAAASTFRILISFFFVSSLSGFIIVMLYITGDQVAVARATLVLAIVNLVLSRALIPIYGIEGAAISCGLSILLLKIYLVGFYYRKHGILSFPSFATHLPELVKWLKARAA
jgi:O-antigen/teichoic acid export membrane protein